MTEADRRTDGLTDNDILKMQKGSNLFVIFYQQFSFLMSSSNISQLRAFAE